MAELKELNDKLHAVDASNLMTKEEMSELIFKQNGMPHRATVQVDPSQNIFEEDTKEATAKGKKAWDAMDPRAVSGNTMDKIDLSGIVSFGS
jgi:hypothetical protein